MRPGRGHSAFLPSILREINPNAFKSFKPFKTFKWFEERHGCELAINLAH